MFVHHLFIFFIEQEECKKKKKSMKEEEQQERLSTIADSYQISTLTFHTVPMTPPINPQIPSASVRTFLISGILWTLLNVSFSIVWSDLLTYQKLL